MKVRIVQVVVSLAVLSSVSKGCSTYSAELADKSLGFCAGVVDYPYLKQENESQEDLERRAAASVTQGVPFLETLLLLLPQSCTSSLKRAACLAVFPRCELIDPYFLNKCPGECSLAPLGGNTTCSSDDSPCSVEPGKVTGVNIPWQEELCAPNGLIWDPVSASCMQALPKFPCKEQCTQIATFDKTVVQNSFVEAMCPLISGYFFQQIIELVQNTMIDEEIRLSADAELALQGCDAASVAGDLQQQGLCAQKPFTVNLLSLFGWAPNCSQTVEVLPEVEMAVFPKDAQPVTSSIQLVVNGNVAALNFVRGSTTACGPTGKEDSISCDAVKSVLGCTSKLLTSVLPVQDIFSTLPSSSFCKDITAAKENQDATVSAFFAAQAAQFETTPSNQATCTSTAIEASQGVFFVPPQPGMPPLASKYDPAGNEKKDAVSQALEASCPAATAVAAQLGITSKYANLADAKLCANGYNARDCVVGVVEETLGSFPSWASYQCQAAFQELVCAQGYMKLEAKTLCLVPGPQVNTTNCELSNNITKAAQENRLGFTYFLPRFPSKKMCRVLRNSCAALFDQVPALDMDCDARVNISSCENPSLTTWGCSSPLNGFPMFPEKAQVLADPAVALPSLFQYASSLKIVGPLVNSFESSVVEPTVSAALHASEASEGAYRELQDKYCSCPEPLVVPDSLRLNGETSPNAIPGSCCELPCIGTMYTEEEFERFGRMQLGLSIVSVALALYMTVSWGVLKVKKTQYFTFWICFCSLQISLAALIMAALGEPEEKYCSDNSTPLDASQGFSMCIMQSIWTIFFALALCGWWMCMSVDLYRKVVRNQRNTDASKRYYHMFCWFIPTASVVFLLSGQYLGYEAPNLYCVIRTDADPLIEWVSFYGIILIMFVVGTATMCRVLFFIYKHMRKLSSKISGGSRKTFATYYRTPILFVLLFSSVWLNIFSFRGVVLLREDTYTEQATSWIGCLLSNMQAGIINPATNSSADTSGLVDPDAGVVGCGMVQPGGIPNLSFYLTYILVFSQSIIIWCIFGLFSNLRKAWKVQLGFSEADSTSKYSAGDSSLNTKARSGTGTLVPASPAMSLQRANQSFAEAYARPSIVTEPDEFSFEGVSAPKEAPPQAPLPPSI